MDGWKYIWIDAAEEERKRGEEMAKKNEKKWRKSVSKMGVS